MKKNRDLKKQEIVDFVKKNKDVLLRELLSKFGKVTSNLIYEMGGLKAIKAGTYKNSPQEKSSQSKSWETRRKDNLFKKYQNAKTSGIKASIARKFKTTYGVTIKSLMGEAQTTVTNNKKIKFEQKPIQLTAPYHIQILQVEVKLLRERIEMLERKK
jgi:hypothetical protein